MTGKSDIIHIYSVSRPEVEINDYFKIPMEVAINVLEDNQILKKNKNKEMCIYGKNCTRKKCRFKH